MGSDIHTCILYILHQTWKYMYEMCTGCIIFWYMYEYELVDKCINYFSLLLQLLKCPNLCIYGFRELNFENLPTGGMETSP